MNTLQSKLALTLIFLTYATSGLFAQSYPWPENGFYEQVGYGHIIEVKENKILIYNSSSVSCDYAVTYPKNRVKNMISFSDITPNSFTNHIQINSYHYKRLDRLPDLCKKNDAFRKKDIKHNFLTLWQTFKEQYAYFGIRNVDWDAMKTKYLAKLSPTHSEFESLMLFDEMLQELNDGHVDMVVPNKMEKQYLKYKEEKKKEENKPKRPSILVPEVWNKLIKNYVPDFKTYHHGIVNWGLINPDVALVQLNGMMLMANYDLPEERSKARNKYGKLNDKSANPMKDELDGVKYIMEKVLKDIDGTKACIIDLRTNGGGMDEVALTLLSHFSDYNGPVFSKKAVAGNGFTPKNIVQFKAAKNTYKGKVIFLTSHITASAAEIFMLSSLVTNPDAIRIGSNTEGIFSDILDKQLPNGWGFGLSNEIYESIDGVNYENIGIPPHHEIDYPKTVYEVFDLLKTDIENDKKDYAVEKAIAILKN